MQIIGIRDGKLILVDSINREMLAYRADTKIVPASPATIESVRKPDSWIRTRAKQVEIGTEQIAGQIEIRIDLNQLTLLGLRSVRNRNKTAKQGPVRAKFTGKRDFKPEVQQ